MISERIYGTIDSFDGEYRFLSNFLPVVVEYDGVSYPSIENAYQAAKTLDLEKRKEFTNCTPGQAKRLGQKLVKRYYWDEIKIEVMAILLLQKFSHPVLKEKLLSTGDDFIVEGNTWGDTFWGVCDGKGDNNLGKLLMQLREFLRK